MRVTCTTIGLGTAKRAIDAYNNGTPGACVKNPNLDRDALQMFTDGLGSSEGKILRQVEFIGRDYGGVAGFPAALVLAEKIAGDIYKNRAEYEQAAYSAVPILRELPSLQTIEILYRPFVKPIHGKTNWLVWASKFWNFLNSDAFPIIDSRVDSFFGTTSMSPSVNKYLAFGRRFRDFALSHQSWLPELRKVDGGDAWCDNKLWDKMCYGLEEINKTKKSAGGPFR